MPDKRRKTEQRFTTLSLLAAMLTGSVFLYASFGSGSAIAATEQTASGAPEQLQEISLEGYAPDQSMWAEKMIAKYEKVKDTGDAPLAMLKIERLNIEAPVYFGTKKITLDRGDEIGIYLSVDKFAQERVTEVAFATEDDHAEAIVVASVEEVEALPTTG